MSIGKHRVNSTFEFSAAADKLLQLCPTLCDLSDGSPPGSPVPGILQARTLEWVAISFSVLHKVRSWHLIPQFHGKWKWKRQKQWQITSFGSKFTADGDGGYTIRRQFLPGSKALTNFKSMLESEDMAWPMEALWATSMVFPANMYRCENTKLLF